MVPMPMDTSAAISPELLYSVEGFILLYGIAPGLKEDKFLLANDNPPFMLGIGPNFRLK